MIEKGLAVAEVAAVVSEALRNAGIESVLSGGSVVTIYAGNEFESKDLDFVTEAKRSELASVMTSLGFTEGDNGLFRHPHTEYLVDFEPAPVTAGDEVLEKWDTLRTKTGRLVLLTPTQSVKDRLAWYYHSSDRPSLKQAINVARSHNVDLEELRRWSEAERSTTKFEEFLAALEKDPLKHP